MAKKRTRAQKIKAAQLRTVAPLVMPEFVLPESPSEPTTIKTAVSLDSFTRRDFVKTLVSTLIVLGVLLLLFVYTRNS